MWTQSEIAHFLGDFFLETRLLFSSPDMLHFLIFFLLFLHRRIASSSVSVTSGGRAVQ